VWPFFRLCALSGLHTPLRIPAPARPFCISSIGATSSRQPQATTPPPLGKSLSPGKSFQAAPYQRLDLNPSPDFPGAADPDQIWSFLLRLPKWSTEGRKPAASVRGFFPSVCRASPPFPPPPPPPHAMQPVYYRDGPPSSLAICRSSFLFFLGPLTFPASAMPQ